MTTRAKRPADTYSPLYFLASLGAGGLTVTFFMFLFFWVPHPNQPVPIFEDIWGRLLPRRHAASGRHRDCLDRHCCVHLP